MNSQIIRWFCDRFVAIDSVRSARIAPENVVVVHTWSGVVIHAHLLDEPPKARTLKRIVQENTRVGIGTLFVIDGALVPDDGARQVIDEGLLALHALLKDKLYTYRLQDGEPKVGQVHLKPFGREEHEVWYGPDVDVRHLPSLRVWVSAPQSIKGTWLIASFGSEAFWKQTDYTVGRDAFRREQNQRTGKYYTWSNPGWTDRGGGYTTRAEPPETQLERSFKALGLTPEAGSDEVKAAFRRLAREVHPDVSELPKDEAEARFKVIYDAYTFIKSANGW